MSNALPRTRTDFNGNTFFLRLSEARMPRGINPQSIIKFAEALAYSGHSTIDSFLATHASNEDYAILGKFSLTNRLLPQEFSFDFHRANADGDWLTYLFERLMLPQAHKSLDAFLSQNQVSFVTFNYDRTLEHFLALRLAYTFGLSEKETQAALSKIPIVHMYGSFGNYEYRPPGTKHRDPLPTEIWQAAQSVRLMHEQRQQADTELQTVMELLNGAESVVILGFGFDPDNVSMLRLSEALDHRRGKKVFHTRFGMLAAEWERARALLGLTTFINVPPNVDCIGLLREHAVLP